MQACVRVSMRTIEIDEGVQPAASLLREPKQAEPNSVRMQQSCSHHAETRGQ